MSRIFISYRRADSAMAAGRLYDHLSAHFGANLVFMDIDTIEPGEDFIEVIQKAVGDSSALVAVIGPDWVTITDANGQRRLDNPNDFVRLEVQTALERNIRVIPVLVDSAVMPGAADLPKSLVSLTRRNALTVSNERFRYDVGKLIETLDKVTQASSQQPVRAPEIEPKPRLESIPSKPEAKSSPKRVVTIPTPRVSILPLLKPKLEHLGNIILSVIIWGIGGAIGAYQGAITTGYNSNGISDVVPFGMVIGALAGLVIRVVSGNLPPDGRLTRTLGITFGFAIVGVLVIMLIFARDINNRVVFTTAIPIIAASGTGDVLLQYILTRR